MTSTAGKIPGRYCALILCIKRSFHFSNNVIGHYLCVRGISECTSKKTGIIHCDRQAEIWESDLSERWPADEAGRCVADDAVAGRNGFTAVWVKPAELPALPRKDGYRTHQFGAGLRFDFGKSCDGHSQFLGEDKASQKDRPSCDGRVCVPSARPGDIAPKSVSS